MIHRAALNLTKRIDKPFTDPIKKMDENIKLEMRKYFKRPLCSKLY